VSFSIPTPTQYAEVTRAVLLRFPNLMPHADADRQACFKHVLHQKIIDRFRNYRHTHFKDHPAVVGGKRKAGSGEGPPKKKSCSTLAYGMANFITKRPEAEDEYSQAYHHKILLDQGQLVHPNPTIYTVSMEFTFAARRTRIVMEEAPFIDIISTYPQLKIEDEFNAEFNRIFGKDGSDLWLTQLVGMSDKLHTLPLPVHKVPLPWPYMKSAEAEFALNETNENKLNLVMAKISALLHERIDEQVFLTDPDEAISSPRIMVSIEHDIPVYSLWINNIFFFSTSSFLKAFQSWFYSFYIFNLVFPVKVKNLVQFIQRALLKISERGKPLSRVAHLICAML